MVLIVVCVFYQDRIMDKVTEEENNKEKYSIETLVPSTFLKRYYKLYKFDNPVVNNRFWLCLDTRFHATDEEIMIFRVNLLKRIVTRRKFLKIVFSKINLLEDIKSNINKFIGLETAEELFKVYFKT
tara:strand:- start:435 stop:815 length:381 start_codon:yes stop_codon:yes gene_type:complete